jgi:methionine aminotransferase
MRRWCSRWNCSGWVEAGAGRRAAPGLIRHDAFPAVPPAQGRHHDFYRHVAPGRRARRDQPVAGLPGLFALAAPARARHATTWRRAPTSIRRWPACLRCARPSRKRWQRLYLAGYDPESEVTVTAGATQAIYTAIAACVRPGDEVIVFAPVYDSYVPGIELNGGHAVYAHLRFPGFKPDWDEVRALITPRTRMIIINSPHNPSGSVWSAEDMAMLEALVRDTQDRRRQRRGLRARGVRPGVGAAARKRDPLPRSARTQLRGVQFRQDLSRHRLEGRLLPGAARADGRVPQGAPVHRVHRASPLAAGAGRLHARAPGIRRRALPPSTRPSATSSASSWRVRASNCCPVPAPTSSWRPTPRSATSRIRSFVQRLTREHGVAAIPVSVFNPDGDDRRVIRFCFAKNEATLAAAGERLRAL